MRGILWTTWQRISVFIRGHFVNPTNKTDQMLAEYLSAGLNWGRGGFKGESEFMFSSPCSWHNPTWQKKRKKEKENNNLDEWTSKSLAVIAFSLLTKIVRCAFQPREREKPTGLVTAEGSRLSCGFCVTDRVSHQQFHKYPTHNWNTHNKGFVGQIYNLKRVCQKPLGGDDWGLSTEVRVPDQSTLNKRRI